MSNNFNKIEFKTDLEEEIKLLDFKSKEDKEKYEKLIESEYIQRKCLNRKKRITEIKSYMNQLVPEILSEKNKGLNQFFVLDIGPGPGELLEIARQHGYSHLGFDAKIEDCEMGSEYIEYSHLMAKRQNLNIEYCDFYKHIGKIPLEDQKAVLINSRGSIEQVFRSHLSGVPHKVHKDAKQLSWVVDEELKENFFIMFKEFSRILISGGVILIHGNGAKNVEKYNSLVIETVGKIDSLFLEASDGQRLHKIRKVIP